MRNFNFQSFERGNEKTFGIIEKKKKTLKSTTHYFLPAEMCKSYFKGIHLGVICSAFLIFQTDITDNEIRGVQCQEKQIKGMLNNLLLS